MKAFDITRRALHLFHVTINQFYFIPYLVWMLLLFPLYFYWPSVYWHIEYILHHWLLHIVASWPWAAGHTVEIVGEDIAPCLEDKALVLVNHQSTADVPMVVTSLLRQGVITPSTMWIMDKIFKFSNFGLIGIVHGNYFIPSGKHVREKGVIDLQYHLKDVIDEHKLKWIMLFPEGGFLRNRLASSQKYAAQHNYPKLNNVALPRFGAFHAILKTQYLEPLSYYGKNDDYENGKKLRVKESNSGKYIDKLKWVVDITVAYEDRRPLDLITVFLKSRAPMKTTVHYRYFPIQELPFDVEQLTKWLIDRWVEKEEMLDAFYKTGRFPSWATSHKLWDSPQKIILNNRFLILINLFFLVSFVIYYFIFEIIFYGLKIW